jgi:hypothetical protein
LHALGQLTTVLDQRGVMSALIGGMALQLLQPLATARMTHDVDVAVLVESFDEYEEIRSELLGLGWAPEPEEHRLRSPEGCLVDLLPYPRKDVVDDHVTLPRSKTPLNLHSRSDRCEQAGSCWWHEPNTSERGADRTHRAAEDGGLDGARCDAGRLGSYPHCSVVWG